MAAPLQMVEAIFLLAANLISNPDVGTIPNGHSDQAQNTLLGIRKYP